MDHLEPHFHQHVLQLFVNTSCHVALWRNPGGGVYCEVQSRFQNRERYKLPDYISHNPPRCRPIGADVCLEDAVGRRIICPLCASHFREREWEREMRNAHWRRVRQDTGSDRGERKTEESQKGIIVGFVYLFIFTYTISLKRIRSKVGLWLWEGEKVSSGHDLVKNKHSVSSTLSYTHTLYSVHHIPH